MGDAAGDVRQFEYGAQTPCHAVLNRGASTSCLGKLTKSNYLPWTHPTTLPPSSISNLYLCVIAFPHPCLFSSQSRLFGHRMRECASPRSKGFPQTACPRAVVALIYRRHLLEPLDNRFSYPSSYEQWPACLPSLL